MAAIYLYNITREKCDLGENYQDGDQDVTFRDELY